MLFNKKNTRKTGEKKLLHKVGKNWQVVSVALLMALGGTAFASHTSHADATTATKPNIKNVNVNKNATSNNGANVGTQANAMHKQIIANNANKLANNNNNVQKQSSAKADNNNSTKATEQANEPETKAASDNNFINANVNNVPATQKGNTITFSIPQNQPMTPNNIYTGANSQFDDELSNGPVKASDAQKGNGYTIKVNGEINNNPGAMFNATNSTNAKNYVTKLDLSNAVLTKGAGDQSLQHFASGYNNLKEVVLPNNFINNDTNVNTVSDMFSNDPSLVKVDGMNDTANNQDLSFVKNAHNMFAGDTSLQNVTLNGFSNALTDTSNMFDGDTALQHASLNNNDDFTNVSDASNMFNNNLNLSGVDFPSVKANSNGTFKNNANLSNMFNGDAHLSNISNLKNLSLANASSVANMFNNSGIVSVSFEPNGSTASDALNIDGVKTLDGMFQNDGSLDHVTFNNGLLGASATTRNMFQHDQNLKSVQFSSHDALTTDTDATSMFESDGNNRSDAAFDNIDLSGQNLGNIQKTNNMFANDYLLRTVNLGDTLPANVLNGNNNSSMFVNDNRLQTLSVGVAASNSSSLQTVKNPWYEYVDEGTGVRENLGYKQQENLFVKHGVNINQTSDASDASSVTASDFSNKAYDHQIYVPTGKSLFVKYNYPMPKGYTLYTKNTHALLVSDGDTAWTSKNTSIYGYSVKNGVKYINPSVYASLMASKKTGSNNSLDATGVKHGDAKGIYYGYTGSAWNPSVDASNNSKAIIIDHDNSNLINGLEAAGYTDEAGDQESSNIDNSTGDKNLNSDRTVKGIYTDGVNIPVTNSTNISQVKSLAGNVKQTNFSNTEYDPLNLNGQSLMVHQDNNGNPDKAAIVNNSSIDAFNHTKGKVITGYYIKDGETIPTDANASDVNTLTTTASDFSNTPTPSYNIPTGYSLMVNNTTHKASLVKDSMVSTFKSYQGSFNKQNDSINSTSLYDSLTSSEINSDTQPSDGYGDNNYTDNIIDASTGLNDGYHQIIVPQGYKLVADANINHNGAFDNHSNHQYHFAFVPENTDLIDYNTQQIVKNSSANAKFDSNEPSLITADNMTSYNDAKQIKANNPGAYRLEDGDNLTNNTLIPANTTATFYLNTNATDNPDSKGDSHVGNKMPIVFQDGKTGKLTYSGQWINTAKNPVVLSTDFPGYDASGNTDNANNIAQLDHDVNGNGDLNSNLNINPDNPQVNGAVINALRHHYNAGSYDNNSHVLDSTFDHDDYRNYNILDEKVGYNYDYNNTQTIPGVNGVDSITIPQAVNDDGYNYGDHPDSTVPASDNFAGATKFNGTGAYVTPTTTPNSQGWNGAYLIIGVNGHTNNNGSNAEPNNSDTPNNGNNNENGNNGNNHPTTSQVTDAISYMDNNNKVGSANVTGNSGDSANSAIDANVPAGYQLANGNGQNINFDGNAHNVNVTKKGATPNNNNNNGFKNLMNLIQLLGSLHLI